MNNLFRQFILIFLFTGTCFHLTAATITWDGGAGTTNWLDAMNWSSDLIPTALDDVDLDGNTVTLASNTTVQRVYAGGSSNLTINTGVILTITGFTGGDDGLEVQNSATVTNNGTIAISNITGSSADGLYVKGMFTNATTGTITIANTAEYGIYVQGGTFTNNGTIAITDYGQSNGDRDGIALDDNGGVIATFNNNAGTITIAMTGGDDGIYLHDGSIFNNTAMLTVGSALSAGDNGIRIDDATFNNNIGGTFTINSTPDDQLFLDAAGICNNSGAIILNTTSDVGLYVTDEGVFTNMMVGTVNITGGSNYCIQVDANNSTAEIINNGTITTTVGKDGLRLQEGGSFTNNVTGTLDINMPNEDGINFQSSGGTLTNIGMIDISNATKEGVDMSAGTFNNNTGATFKAIDCLQDNIEINGTSIVNNDGDMQVSRSGADASGRDDIEVNSGATFTNTANATFAPGVDTIGEMEVRGTVDFGTSITTFEINGTTNTTEFDRIELVSTTTDVTVTSATAHLDWGTYIPVVNDEFEIVNGPTGSTVSGPFGTVTTSNSDIVTSQIDTDTSVIIKVTALLICDDVTSLSASNIASTSADFSWSTSINATNYNWIVVAAGAGPTGTIVDSGMTTDTFATSTSLSSVISYDLYIQTDCGTIGLGNFAGPYNFITTCPGGLSATVTTTMTDVACNGGTDGAIDLSVTGGVPAFTFAWSTGDTTEDVTGLAAGTYVVTITDGNGCPGSETYTITEPTALAVSLSSVPDTAGVGVGSIMATVTGGTAPYVYTWDGTAGTADLTALTTGTYVVSVTDANNCSDTASIFVDDFVSTTALDYVTNLSIAPNPTNGNVVIDLALSENANVGISIYTITGVLVADFGTQNTTRQTQRVDLSTYAEGMYFVRFAIDNQVITKKIVLTK